FLVGKEDFCMNTKLTILVFGILFIAFGVAIALGKVHTHLKEWKATPQSERDKIAIKPLCRNVGGMISLCGVIFAVKGLFYGIPDRLFLLLMLLWIAAAFIDFWQMGKKGWYIRDDKARAAMLQQRSDIAAIGRSTTKAPFAKKKGKLKCK
ncbi:MAG: DUF3784 domain-containing protein, partial [Clostridiales bacterium]|nr:DUF3784 domain-containing protein [Clostridiales bacterium]